MSTKRLFCLIALLLTVISSKADDWKEKLVKQGIYKFRQIEAYNKANDARGQSHLNEYVIELNPNWKLDANWIEEKPDRVILSRKYEALSLVLKDFNDRKDMLRFYVVVINNFEAQLNETVDFGELPSKISNLDDYVQLPSLQLEYKRFREKIASIPAEILGTMKTEGFHERIVYFYGTINLYKSDKKRHAYRHDYLYLEGERLDETRNEITAKAKSGISSQSAAAEKIEQIVLNVTNAVKVVIDGEGSGTPQVDCSKGFDELVASTAKIKADQYSNTIKSLVSLLDEAPANQYIINSPAALSSDDLFTKETLPDKLDVFSKHGRSPYKLFIVFKEINFALAASDWPKIAEDVYNQSRRVKESKSIVMVIPYLPTLCTGTTWLGLTVNKGTGLLMPSVYSDNEILTSQMNAALVMNGSSWKANFNQAYSYIPKRHVLIKYAISYDFITKRYDTQEKVIATGNDEIFDLQIYVDGRLQAFVDAKVELHRQMISKAPSPGALQESRLTLEGLPGRPSQPSLLKHGLKETTLADTQGSGKGLFSPVGEQFVKWFVAGKAAESEATTYSALANKFDGATNPPGHLYFIGGVNPVILDNYYAALDAAGIVLNFLELDWITDGGGYFIAYYYRDTDNQVIYATSLALPIGAVVVRVIAKKLKTLKQTTGGGWELVEETTGDVIRITEKLAFRLSGPVKATYEDLVTRGIKFTDDGATIKFFDTNGDEIATVTDDKFTPRKWASERGAGVTLVSKTESGYHLVKNGSGFAFDLGFKTDRIIPAEEANEFFKAIGKNEPYKPGTKVQDRILQPSAKVYVVENLLDDLKDAVPNPGSWGSAIQISSEKELREYLAVLEKWKHANGIKDPLVVREYTVREPFRVREGFVGPQKEKTGPNTGAIYNGGEHQYEFYDYPGNSNWKKYFDDPPVVHEIKVAY